VIRRLIFALALAVPYAMRAQDAPPADLAPGALASQPVAPQAQTAKPPAEPMAVKALKYLNAKPNNGPTSWTNGPYAYDGAGNISGIGSEAYVYDTTGRLTNATLRGPDLSSMQTQSFTYDEYGNLTSTTKLGQTIPLTIVPGENKNRLSGIGYDASGNVITAGSLHYDYDAVGMVNQVRVGASNAPQMIYAYTADDERLFAFAVSANTTHWTLRGLDNKVLRDFRQTGATWSVERDYVYRDGLLLAALGSSGVEHFSLDQLGTVRLVTNGSGQKIGYHVYWPFGEEWSPGNPQEGSPLKFTGHERDADPSGASGSLDYMHARHYRSGWGRFLSVDPVTDFQRAFRYPQAWNRYSYVENNPINMTDPTGKCGWCTSSPQQVMEEIEARAAAGDPLARTISHDTANGVEPVDGPAAFINGPSREGGGLLAMMAAAFIKGGLRDVTREGGEIIIKSAIRNDTALIRFAEDAGRNSQKSLDNLVSSLAKGNLNPGIGTKNLFGNIMYARSRDGARVFFRTGRDGSIEILAKATKANEKQVIKRLEDLYR
jgi:RHS repeat-associated protein